jgi:hypothetical protein
MTGWGKTAPGKNRKENMLRNNHSNSERLFLGMLIVSVCLMLERCTKNPVAGNTVETGNARVAGIIRGTDNTPVSGAVVHLLPTTYNPLRDQSSLLSVDTTGNDGSYILYADTGVYNIFADLSSNTTKAMKSGVAVIDSSDVTVEDMRLSMPGAVVVDLDTASVSEPGSLYIPGTFTVKSLDRSDLAAGFVSIDGLAASQIPQVRFSIGGQDETSDMLIAAGFTVAEGQTVRAPTGSLPKPWQSVSIGETPAGGAVYCDSQFIVVGGGPDIWNETDGFQFVYQSLSGDWDIIIHLDSMPPAQRYSKAGIMARFSLDPQSVNVAITIDYVRPIMVCAMQYRGQFGDTTAVIHRSFDETPHKFDYSPPIWLRLTRSGDLFTGYVSRDRGEWYRIGSVTIPMESEILIGMAVTSHSEQVLHTGVFSSLEIQ